MNVLGLTKVTMRLTTGEAKRNNPILLAVWFAGYITGPQVTPYLEKTMVKFDCIFQPAPEDSSQV
jgi:hypothetical protein